MSKQRDVHTQARKTARYTANSGKQASIYLVELCNVSIDDGAQPLNGAFQAGERVVQLRQHG